MYKYNIKQNGYPIGQTIGKYKAFQFISAQLNGRIGLWFGDKCVLKDEHTIYTIERLYQ